MGRCSGAVSALAQACAPLRLDVTKPSGLAFEGVIV